MPNDRSNEVSSSSANLDAQKQELPKGDQISIGRGAPTSPSEALLLDAWSPPSPAWRASMPAREAPRQELTRMNEASLSAAADALRTHSGVDTFLSLGAVDTAAIISLLKGISPSDRRLLEIAYNSKHGDWPLKEMLKARAGDDWAKIDILLTADEGEANFAGYVRHAVEKLHRIARQQGTADGAAGGTRKEPLDEPTEKFIRETLSVMNSRQIEDMMRDYKRVYGEDVSMRLSDANILSEKTRRALQIYLKGTEQRTGNDTTILGSLALEYGDENMFQEAFRGAAREVRDNFRTAFKGHEQIDRKLYWADRDLAHDYLDTGAAGLLTLIKANTHWLHKNKDAIKLAIDSATEEERQMFIRGRDIQLGRRQKETGDEKATAFYHSIHAAFGDAAYDWEVHGWESRLATGSPDGLIERISRTHSDGFLGSAVFSSTDVNALLAEIEQMTEPEWKRLKLSKESRQDLEACLDAIWMPDPDRQRVDDLLARKLNAETFELSKRCADVRDIFEHFKGAGLLPIGRDSQKLLDGLIHMHLDQQMQFGKDPQFQEFVRNYVDSLDDGAQKLLGQRIIDKLARRQPLVLDAVDTFLYDSLNRDNAVKILTAVQSNRQLQEAIKSDPSLKTVLSTAFSSGDMMASGVSLALQKRLHQRIVDELLTDGWLPISKSLALARSAHERFDMLRAAPQSEIEKLTSTTDRKDALVHFSHDEQAVINSIIAATREKGGGKRLVISGEDAARAFVVGLSDKDSVVAAFSASGIDAGGKAEARAAYAQKYGSDMISDVLGKIPAAERTSFELMLAQAQAPAARAFLENSLENSTSRGPLDDWMKEGWDGTVVQRGIAINDYGAALAEASKVFGDLPQAVQDVLARRVEQAQELYRNSKREAADNVINAVIMAIAFAASAAAAVPSGGSSMALFAALAKINVARMAVLGALLKVGGKEIMEGTDHDDGAGALVKDLAEGAIAGAIMRVGPAEFSQIFKPFQELGGRVSSPVMELFEKIGSTEQARVIHSALAERLPQSVSNIVGESLSERIGSAMKFGPDATRAVHSALADRLPRTVYGIVNGQSVHDAASRLINALPCALDDAMRTQFVKETEQLLLNEMNAATEKILLDTARGYGQSTTLGATAGFATGATDRIFKWDPSKSVEQNLEEVLDVALASASDGAEMAVLLHTAATVAAKTGKLARSNLPSQTMAPDGNDFVVRSQTGEGRPLPLDEFVETYGGPTNPAATAKLQEISRQVKSQARVEPDRRSTSAGTGSAPAEAQFAPPPGRASAALPIIPTRAVTPARRLLENIRVTRSSDRATADGWTHIDIENTNNPGETYAARINQTGAVEELRANEWTRVDASLDFWKAVKDELGLPS